MLTVPPSADIAPEKVRPLRRREYEALVADGHFSEERIELLQGTLVEMSPQDPRHAAAIQRLTNVLTPALSGRALVRVQLPLAISPESEPEPDLAVVACADYDIEHPTAAILVIEVSDASLAKDRRLKSELYAAAGIAEYWVVNLVDDVVEVHTEAANGKYRSTTTYDRTHEIQVHSFRDVVVAAREILPRRP